ncbi:(2Fe-2S)-binding protein [bacterium]|nr:(2Fe-2S)-binding protein [bacterium]
MEFKIIINNKNHKITCQEDEILINVLRDHLHLTGTKRGCDIGACGSCTVIINGQAKRSCVVKISQVNENDKIETIEGLEKNGKLHPLQDAFIKKGAVQCGFCTPGMIMSAKALLDSDSNPTDEDIKKALAGNLCRCTGYKQIIEAIRFAAESMKS